MNGVLSPTAQGHPHGHSGSPVKESSFLHRETSADENDEVLKKTEPELKTKDTTKIEK
jgi:hypothetical protein